MSSHIQMLDENATAGKSAERKRKNEYASLCWIACPTSWAATAVALIDTLVVDRVREVNGALARVVVIGERAARRDVTGTSWRPFASRMVGRPARR